MNTASTSTEQTNTAATGNSSGNRAVLLCPGQGAQAIGMGKAWAEQNAAAKAVFEEADRVLGDQLGLPLSTLCFDGPAERLNQTDVAQPALYTAGVASYRGLLEQAGSLEVIAAAGLSLGEYTALHLAGVFDFKTGLELVAHRGRYMQEAAEASDGGMLALIGADEAQAAAICEQAVEGTDEVLVPANFNAPGQIVLSGHSSACERAAAIAAEAGLRATPLTVAGAFHSPLMQPAADRMAEALAAVEFRPPQVDVWSNVTAEPHDAGNLELISRRLIEQITSPVRWSQGCAAMAAAYASRSSDDQSSNKKGPGIIIDWHELAPGAVLRGLMRRIDRSIKVISHDEPDE